LPVEQKSQEEPMELITSEFSPSERILYGLLGTDGATRIDDLVESSGLNSSEVLATLFDLEMKGMVRQLPGKQFLKVLL
jgi:DNA processing protein